MLATATGTCISRERATASLKLTKSQFGSVRLAETGATRFSTLSARMALAFRLTGSTMKPFTSTRPAHKGR